MIESEAAIEEAKQKKASEQHRHAKQQKVPEEAPKVVPETTDYAAGLNGPAEQVCVFLIDVCMYVCMYVCIICHIKYIYKLL